SMRLSFEHDDVDGLTGEVTVSEEAGSLSGNTLFPVPESRNAPCPCGSGLKYKQCHGKI
ncbi:MAG: hypothetical protein RIQ74_884, partial [Pseudomonadota bacterium]